MLRWLYVIILVFSLLVAGGCWFLYQTMMVLFSDLEVYGIRYGSEAYIAAVKTAQRQYRMACIPLGILLALSLIGWAVTLWSKPHRSSQ